MNFNEVEIKKNENVLEITVYEMAVILSRPHCRDTERRLSTISSANWYLLVYPKRSRLINVIFCHQNSSYNDLYDNNPSWT